MSGKIRKLFSHKQSKKEAALPGVALPPAKPALGAAKTDPESTAIAVRPTSSHDETFPDGIKVLVNPQDATVDICFVHGLTGNRVTTWTAKDEKEPWPQKLLPNHLPHARILTYGYDAYIVHKQLGQTASSNRLSDHAQNFLSDLTTDRSFCNATARPLILVAHSLGGLVCKEAVLSSRDNPEKHLQDVFLSTKAIVFLGTPHQGSWMASWAKIPARSLGVVKSTNRNLLTILEESNEFLASIQQRFLAMLRNLEQNDRQLAVTCFYEELPLLLTGPVVSKDSATFPGYAPMSIHANHSEMVKFGSAEDNGFRRVVGELMRWYGEISNINARDYVETALAVLGIPVDKMAEVARVRARAAFEASIRCTDLEHRAHALCSHPQVGAKDTRDSINRADFKARYERLVKDCLNTFSFDEMGLRESIVELPKNGTCKWIYEDETYHNWATQKSSLLWIKGKPGSGKSVLMKSLYSYRASLEVAEPRLLLAFFFNARGAQTEKIQLGLYSTLMHNLLAQDPILMAEFLPKIMVRIQNQGERARWSVVELANMFHSIIETTAIGPLEIFIDALDECNDDDVRDFVDRFETSIEKVRESDTSLRVCWSSRYYPHISLRSSFGLELELDQRNDGDIGSYIEKELSMHSNQSLAPFQKQLKDRAKGVFLWVVLVIKRLRKAYDQGKSTAQMQSLLSSMPTELDDLFGRIYAEKEICAEDRVDLVRILQWIFCSVDEATVTSFFAYIIMTRTIRSAAKGFFQNINEPLSGDRVRRERYHVNDVSCGLIEVVIAKQDTQIQVIHESVREFFLSSKRSLEILATSSRTEFFRTGHTFIGAACLRALSAIYMASLQLESSPPMGQGFEEDVRHDSLFETIKDALYSASRPFIVYAFRFAFFHVMRAIEAHQGDETASQMNLESTAIRRNALLTFFAIEHSSLPSSHTTASSIQGRNAVFADPSYFGVTQQEVAPFEELEWWKSELK